MNESDSALHKLRETREADWQEVGRGSFIARSAGVPPALRDVAIGARGRLIG